MIEEQKEVEPILDKRVVAANKHLNEHWKNNRGCPICEETNWELLASGMLPVNNGQILFNSYYPVTGLACRTCGYIFLVSSVMLGVEDKKEERNDTNNRDSNRESERDPGRATEDRSWLTNLCSWWRLFWPKIWNVTR